MNVCVASKSPGATAGALASTVPLNGRRRDGRPAFVLRGADDVTDQRRGPNFHGSAILSENHQSLTAV